MSITLAITLFGQPGTAAGLLKEISRKRLKAILSEIAEEFGIQIREMELMPDHCHVFVSCHPKLAPSDIVKCLKGITARKLLLEFPVIKKKLWGGHLWNPSYYIGTVGNMSKEVVLRYIQQSESTGK